VTPTQTLPQATLPVVRSLLSKASGEGKRKSGVLALRARPVWTGQDEFTHPEYGFRVVPCVSALAVREALRNRDRDRWLVIITDRDENDLGLGITSHFYGEVLRNPDPWDAVRDQFGANAVDRRLVTARNGRDLASGILAAQGNEPWPPARGGFLTLDHVCATVAKRQLGLIEASENLAPEEVLTWAVDRRRTARLADLKALSGEHVAELVATWMAERCGQASEIVTNLFAMGRADDVVPLGVACRALLDTPPNSEPWVLLRVQHLNLPAVDQAALRALVTTAETVTQSLLASHDDGASQQVGRVLARADALVGDLHATATAESSLLLRSSLTSRLARLGDLLGDATAKSCTRAIAASPDTALISEADLDGIEAAYSDIMAHALARHADEVRVPRATAGVRLARYLTSSTDETGAFPELMQAHRDTDAWVDRAYSDAWRGVDEAPLSDGLRGVLDAVRLRRDNHDLTFARALAAFTASVPSLPQDVLLVEDVLSKVVVPVARVSPVLLIVADGMSAAVATEIVDDTEEGLAPWFECLPAKPKQTRRSVAVSVLPSLTQVSRTSLLSGGLATGNQQIETAGFTAFLKAHGLKGALFHKLMLDSSGAGVSLTQEVGAAVDDTVGTPVVACVLNTIDDALDRSDPGIDWTQETVTHLRPLLERARRAGRTVILTSDHGHVIERRDGRKLNVGTASSNRSRPGIGGPEPETDEIRVRGTRVLVHDGDTILAVNERLRYGVLKAGYHGGGSPAEVVVPIHVLTPSEPPGGWALAAPQSPVWWDSPITATDITRPEPSPETAILPPSASPTLFDEVPVAQRHDLVEQVLASAVYVEQRKRAQRVPLTDDQIGSLLRYAMAAPDHRLDRATTAKALGVAEVQLGGALPMVQRLLNVEQYPVLDRDPDGVTIILDVTLLIEQFGVRS